MKKTRNYWIKKIKIKEKGDNINKLENIKENKSMIEEIKSNNLKKNIKNEEKEIIKDEIKEIKNNKYNKYDNNINNENTENEIINQLKEKEIKEKDNKENKKKSQKK